MSLDLRLNLELRPLEASDIPEVVAAFAAIGWADKNVSRFQRYLEEQESGTRVTRFAFLDGVFAGYLNIVWESGYSPFRAEQIPEIRDFNVLPRFQKQGVGTALMDEAERVIATRSAVAGIGVGMTPDYGAAQRLYVKRGYIPDGRGLMTHEQPVVYGQTVVVDDGLVLFFTRRL